jgi:CDP-glucose 4,6-dehydratase
MGFLGGWLVQRLLESGAQVVCLLRDWTPQSHLRCAGWLESVSVVQGDVTDQRVVERVLGEYEVATVFHLAAQTIVPIANRNPISTFESNIRGTWTVLEACRRSPAVRQIIVASSDKAYGEQEVLPYSERTSMEGCYPYDVSKSCADLLAHTYWKTYGLPVCVTRCGNFYGGGDLHWNRIVPGTIRDALHGRRPVIRSDGSPIRDYLYVEDGAAAYMLLAEKMAADPAILGEAFNFSNEQPISVLDLVRMILDVLGSPLAAEVQDESTGEILRQCLSAERARSVLGWRPRYSLCEGLARTVQWYRQYLGAEGAQPPSSAHRRQDEAKHPAVDVPHWSASGVDALIS